MLQRGKLFDFHVLGEQKQKQHGWQNSMYGYVDISWDAY